MTGIEVLPRSSACISTIEPNLHRAGLPHLAIMAGGKFNCGTKLSDEAWVYNHRRRHFESILALGATTTATLMSSRDNANPGINAAACVYFPPSNTFFVFGGEESTGYSTRLQKITLRCGAGYESAANSSDFSHGCHVCPRGTYSSTTLEACQPCPSGFSTQRNASSAIAQCTVCARLVQLVLNTTSDHMACCRSGHAGAMAGAVSSLQPPAKLQWFAIASMLTSLANAASAMLSTPSCQPSSSRCL